MEIYILSIIVFLLSCKKVENTDNSKSTFMVKNNTWYISQNLGGFCKSCRIPHKIIFGGDTIIKSKKYTSIYDYTGDSVEYQIKSGRLLGYLRETDDKKVYWYWGNEDNPARDHLLFDFNLQVHDSIGSYFVKTVDSIKLQNQYKKRITLVSSCGPNKVWIEEIGDMTELLNPILYCDKFISIGGGSYKQTCFVNKGEVIYKDTSCTECWNYKR